MLVPHLQEGRAISSRFSDFLSFLSVACTKNTFLVPLMVVTVFFLLLSFFFSFLPNTASIIFYVVASDWDCRGQCWAVKVTVQDRARPKKKNKCNFKENNVQVANKLLTRSWRQ